MYDALIFWIPIVAGGIFATAAFSALYAGEKIHAVWYGFGAVVGFSLLAAIQIDHSLRVVDAQPEIKRTEEPKVDAIRSSDERPLLIFESISTNPQEWRMGANPFVWSFRFRNYGKRAAKVTNIHFFATISDSVPAVDGTPRGTTIYSPRPYIETVDVGPIPIVDAGAQTQEFSARGDHSPLKMDTGLPPDIREQRSREYLFSVMPDNGPPTINSEGIHFWLVGRVDYKDIFEGKTHSTQFGVYLTNPFHKLAEYPDPSYNFQN